MPKKKTAQNGLAEAAETKPAKKKRDWVPNPQKDFGQENVEPGDNSRFLRLARVAMDLPPIDISDSVQVENRINEYFDFCEANDKKPQKIEMAGWIGVHIDTLHSWAKGECRAMTHSSVIKKADAILHSLWVDYMQNGKINPGSGIFLGKNMYGYRDVVDIVAERADPLGDKVDPEELRKRIEDNIVIDDYEVEDG